MSILSRYTSREILSHLAGVIVIVVAIFMVRRFADLLGDAARGDLPSGVLLHLLGLRTVMALPSLLPVGLYVAILLGLGRLYDDNEITAMTACGVPARRMYAAVLTVAVGAAAVAASLSFWARPWAAVAFHEVRDTAARETGIAQLNPGRFYELNGPELTVFADGHSATDPHVVENVFVQVRDAAGLSVLSAARATEVADPASGARVLRLLDGYRYDFGPAGKEIDITRYEAWTLRTPVDATAAGSTQDHSLSALALARSSDPEDAAELQWRIAAPVATILLAMLAIALSRIRPGKGRSAKLLVAVVLYIGYGQLLGATKKWVANGLWSPWPGTWVVHGLCFAAALLLLAYRPAELGWRGWGAPSRRPLRANAHLGVER